MAWLAKMTGEIRESKTVKESGSQGRGCPSEEERLAHAEKDCEDSM